MLETKFIAHFLAASLAQNLLPEPLPGTPQNPSKDTLLNLPQNSQNLPELTWNPCPDLWNDSAQNSPVGKAR